MNATKSIPPGYLDDRDGDKPTNRQKFGDLVIWKELIKRAKEEGDPVIFVTDDQKEDWFVKDGKKAILGRPELIREMKKEAGQDFLLYTADQFLWRAGRILKEEVTDETAEEVKSVGRGPSFGAGMMPHFAGMAPSLAAKLAEVNLTSNDSMLGLAQRLQGDVTPATNSIRLAAMAGKDIMGPIDMARLSMIAAENLSFLRSLRERMDDRIDDSVEEDSEDR